MGICLTACSDGTTQIPDGKVADAGADTAAADSQAGDTGGGPDQAAAGKVIYKDVNPDPVHGQGLRPPEHRQRRHQGRRGPALSWIRLVGERYT
jgi:hypothetical protein